VEQAGDVDGVREPLATLLDGYVPSSAVEAADLARLRLALDRDADVWSRSTPLHVTASALVVHPPSGRVVLRWHERMASWLQVGGHFDPGEADPLAVALREAREETGLTDLRVAPGTRDRPLHLAIVPVVPGGGEPAHEHADIRYLLVTDEPDAIIPETAAARLRWSTMDAAMGDVTEENLRILLRRAASLLDTHARPGG
jgi:8-oxo-dGTP pyrophosphatase MutT (NUDIX family)